MRNDSLRRRLTALEGISVHPIKMDSQLGKSKFDVSIDDILREYYGDCPGDGSDHPAGEEMSFDDVLREYYGQVRIDASGERL